jgi:hypothetical protein
MPEVDWQNRREAEIAEKLQSQIKLRFCQAKVASQTFAYADILRVRLTTTAHQ